MSGVMIDELLARSPLQSISRIRSSRQLAVLAYHGIDDPGTFEQHLRLLKEEFRPVALADLLEAVEFGRGLPPNAVLLTFDDGARSLLDVGAPLLARYGVPAVVFIVAGHLDTDQPFWWDEVKAFLRMGGTLKGSGGMPPEALVRELKRMPNDSRVAAIEQLRSTAGARTPRVLQLRRSELGSFAEAGIAVGNHSLTHPCLNRCDEATIEAELSESQRILTDAIGYPPRVHAYPNGDTDPRVTAIVRKAGFRLAFLFDHRLTSMPPADPFGISRVRVNSTTSVARLRTIASGLHPAIHRLRGRR